VLSEHALFVLAFIYLCQIALKVRYTVLVRIDLNHLAYPFVQPTLTTTHSIVFQRAELCRYDLEEILVHVCRFVRLRSCE
jgi:hypothetical protein